MRSFNVIVHPGRVQVDPIFTHEIRHPDFIALVDGERFAYRIERHKHTDKNSNWRDRGTSQVYYHANNSGNIVSWIPVLKSKRTRKLDISDKQMSMF